jgi:hypothetical protein
VDYLPQESVGFSQMYLGTGNACAAQHPHHALYRYSPGVRYGLVCREDCSVLACDLHDAEAVAVGIFQHDGALRTRPATEAFLSWRLETTNVMVRPGPPTYLALIDLGACPARAASS